MKNSARSENSRKSLNSIGLSSLLVIFVVLASVTLSVMCLITVRQDLDRAKKLAVTSWKIISNNYYEEENSLPVWNGESLPV